MATPCERPTNYLRPRGAVSVPMTFLELEGVRGKPLPASARKYAAWWSNTQPHARCWTIAGYKVAHVSLAKATFIFVRLGKGASGDLRVRRRQQRWPAVQLLADLDREFVENIAACTKRAIFTGPSVPETLILEGNVGGVDGTRTRDLRRDRPAF